MHKKSGYTHAMEYQKRLDEKTGIQPLPSPRKFIEMCGVSSAQPKSIFALKSLCLEALCMQTLTNSKKQLLTETLQILDTETIQ